MRTKQEYQDALDELKKFVMAKHINKLIVWSSYQKKFNLLQELIDNLKEKQNE